MKLEYFLEIYLRERPLFLSLIRAKEAELYQRYLPLKRPVLDVGVGDGFFAKMTFGNSLIDVGLDLPNSRIDEAGKTGIYKKLITYDDGKIPFPSRSFQTVVSNCVLEHISHLELAIKEVYRVLRPGGLFLTTVMAKPWEDNLFGAKILGDFYKKWMREKQIHLNLLKREDWDKIFQKAEFKISHREGYLSSSACQLIDISHYLSFPNLISYKLLGKWVLFPQVTKLIYPINFLVRILSEKVSTDESGAIFYALRKV